MLQIKNTLGGGKPNAPYAWAKYNTIENPIYYINPSFTAKVITAGSVFEIVTSTFDASKVDTSFFEGFEFDVNTVNLSVYKENGKYYISKGGNLSSPREFTYDPTTMRFNINNLSDSIGTGLPLNGGKYTGNKPTGEYEIVADSLIEYIIDDSPNKYPNGEVHTDGFFYRYAPEGLYAWKKLSAQGGDFIDYIVSDKETAYPDGGEKGGYWYEKVGGGLTPEMFGCTKMAVDTLILTSATQLSTYTVNHSLGEIPKVILVMSEIAPTVAWRLNRCLCDNSKQSTRVDCTTSYYNNGLVTNNSNYVNSITNSSFIIYSQILSFDANVKYNIITMV